MHANCPTCVLEHGVLVQWHMYIAKKKPTDPLKGVGLQLAKAALLNINSSACSREPSSRKAHLMSRVICVCEPWVCRISAAVQTVYSCWSPNLYTTPVISASSFVSSIQLACMGSSKNEIRRSTPYPHLSIASETATTSVTCLQHDVKAQRKGRLFPHKLQHGGMPKPAYDSSKKAPTVSPVNFTNLASMASKPVHKCQLVIPDAPGICKVAD